MSAADFESPTSILNSRKRSKNQSSGTRKKLRLDEGTSPTLGAKERLRQVRATLLDEIGINPDTFVYPPLKTAIGQEIRVLIIEPGEGNDPIVCRLVPSSLPKSRLSETKSDPYTALSYFWGSGLPIHPITITNYVTPSKRMKAPADMEAAVFKIRKHKDWCSSGTKYVRTNLYMALQRFRQKNKKTHMWIDALCIDQDDKFERSDQVKQMHELYIQAEGVKIWLGDGSSARGVGSIVKEPGNTAKEKTPKRCFAFLRKILNLQKLDKLLDRLGNGKLKQMDAARLVVQLMCNTWFSRRWVIQELALAREAEVVYGQETMLWSDFADAIAIFIKSQERIGTVLSKMIAEQASSVAELRPADVVKNYGANALVDFINNLFRRAENGDIQQRMMTLECLVSNLLAFEATNPRDTIYAVLSLAKDTYNLSTETNANATHLALDERLSPAYHNCLLDVYTDFIEYCIDKSQSLDILLRHWATQEKTERQKTLFSNISSTSRLDSEQLPTWIPLIQKSSYGGPKQRVQGRSNGDGFAEISFSNSQRKYNATLNMVPERKFGRVSYPAGTLHVDQRKKYNGELFVKGRCFGTVEKTTQRAAQGMIFRESLELAGFDYAWWQDNQEWAKGIPRVPERFWRTIVADRGHDGTNPPSWYPRACLESLYNLRQTGDLNPDEVINLDKASSMAKLFLQRVKDVVWERSIARIQLDGENQKYTYGLIPKEAKEGDKVCVFFGCSVPVILRRQENGNADGEADESSEEDECSGSNSEDEDEGEGDEEEESLASDSEDGDKGDVEGEEESNVKEVYFHMIGECFVYGMMDGEAVADREWKCPYSDAEGFLIK